MYLLRHGVFQQVLNEVVVDRGPSSYLTNLEIYCNDHHITSVQGDGEMQCLQSVQFMSFLFHFVNCARPIIKERITLSAFWPKYTVNKSVDNVKIWSITT